jgi:hypothetical protein
MLRRRSRGLHCEDGVLCILGVWDGDGYDNEMVEDVDMAACVLCTNTEYECNEPPVWGDNGEL